MSGAITFDVEVTEMCGRYFIDDGYDPEIIGIIGQINERYADTTDLAKMKTGEVFPTDIAPVITAQAPVLMKWGFPRFDGKGQVINARIETASEKPMFRKPFAVQRCLVPANHYFEWQKTDNRKQKYAISQDGPLYMAGLYKYDDNEPTPLFVILTRPAVPDIRFIHDRMPVILRLDMRDAWVSGRLVTADLLGMTTDHIRCSQA